MSSPITKLSVEKDNSTINIDKWSPYPSARSSSSRKTKQIEKKFILTSLLVRPAFVEISSEKLILFHI